MSAHAHAHNMHTCTAPYGDINSRNTPRAKVVLDRAAAMYHVGYSVRQTENKTKVAFRTAPAPFVTKLQDDAQEGKISDLPCECFPANAHAVESRVGAWK
jgi:hypothetical protein